MSKRKIITIFYGDLSSPQGPMIHYTELWNTFQTLYGDRYAVEGWFLERVTQPNIMKVNFPARMIRIPKIFDRNYIWGLYYDLLLALRMIRNRKEIIYSRHWFYPFFTSMAIKWFGIRIVYELNSIIHLDSIKNGLPSWKVKLFSWMERVQIRNAVGCIAVSEGIEEYAKEKGTAKHVCILNGVSMRFFEMERSRQTPSTIKVLYVGSFTSWDGAAQLSILVKHFPKVHFTFIGDGEGRKETEKRCEPYNNVSFEGYVNYNETTTYYLQHDIGIVLYDKERNHMKLSSLKTLEYMASGLAIFSTRVPGQEFIEENKIGLLTDFNSEEELVRDFQNFLNDLSLYKKNVDLYRLNDGRLKSWETTAKQTEAFIQTCFN